jgi:hypothetical protein
MRSFMAAAKTMIAEWRAMNFVEEFSGKAWPRHCRCAFGDQHRRIPGRVQSQKCFPAIPGQFFHQPRVEPVFAEREPHKAGPWTERVMEQCEHAASDAQIRFNKRSRRAVNAPTETWRVSDRQVKRSLTVPSNFTDLPLRQHGEWATRARVQGTFQHFGSSQMLADL